MQLTNLTTTTYVSTLAASTTVTTVTSTVPYGAPSASSIYYDDEDGTRFYGFVTSAPGLENVIAFGLDPVEPVFNNRLCDYLWHSQRTIGKQPI